MGSFSLFSAKHGDYGKTFVHVGVTVVIASVVL